MGGLTFDGGECLVREFCNDTISGDFNGYGGWSRWLRRCGGGVYLVAANFSRSEAFDNRISNVC